jgi:opacity protein-like surface antigen
MKRFLMTLVVAAVFMATSAQAANGQLYVSGNLAFGILTDTDIGGDTISYDPGFGIMGAVGFDGGQFRIEGELAYRDYGIDTVTISGTAFQGIGSISALSFMANGYADIEIPNSPLTPYVGVGMGFVDLSFNVGGTSYASGTEVAYQFMAGTAFDISPKAALTVGYRFFGFTDNEGSNVHELNIGARFMF